MRRALGGIALLAALVVAPLTAQTPKHNCSFCHDLHGGSYTALTKSPTSQALCESCHGPSGPITVDRDGTPVIVPKNVDIHNGLKHTKPTSCWNCHDHEGESTGNLKMIPLNRTGAALGATRPILFSAYTGTNSFADGNALYDGVCEVCHTITDEHRFDGGASKHNAAADCRVCHKHAGGFQGSGRCTLCHKQTQGPRRVIVSEFGRLSHHIDWVAAGLVSADSIPDDDCKFCHDQSLHKQGNVRLWNPDFRGDLSQVVVLTGDPNTSITEAAKLEPVCLGCHDANGAAGNLTPFSDGVTRPLIDAATWVAASHATSAGVPAGCFGDGTSGCHATGHGSEKRHLLAPSTVAAVAPDLIAEQEGFCLACHDGSPAATNLKADFDRPINWVQLATGLNDNPNLNDRHDVAYAAQTRSGAKIECTDCHNPHAATAAQPYILDPDPGDGHVVGTNWYFAAYQAANDRKSEFCLDCHDGSFPAGVLGHSPIALTNIRTTWVNDGMGARTGTSVDLRTGIGYTIGAVLACETCHVVHLEPDADVSNTPNLFHVRDTVYDATGTVPLYYQGRNASDPQIYAYGMTDNSNKADETSGFYWCNSCHNRYAMSGKQNCYSCHRHGDGNRF